MLNREASKEASKSNSKKPDLHPSQKKYQNVPNKKVHHVEFNPPLQVSPINNEVSPFNLCRNFEEKSNKSKRKLFNKTLVKMSKLNHKLKEEQKNYTKIIKDLTVLYDEKLKRANKEFKYVMESILKAHPLVATNTEQELEKSPEPVEKMKSLTKIEAPLNESESKSKGSIDYAE